MTHTWKNERASEQIAKRISEVNTVSIVDYVRKMSLENIPVNKGYVVIKGLCDF